LLQLTQEHVLTLQQYQWPGNVRELQNVIERAVITSRGGAVRFDLDQEDLAPQVKRNPPSEVRRKTRSDVVTEAERTGAERENILIALERAHWKIYGPGGAAELLGVKPTTLASRIKKMGITHGDKTSS
jgi:transcriptional regulator with GAF, ATPase, and Fis domain